MSEWGDVRWHAKYESVCVWVSPRNAFDVRSPRFSFRSLFAIGACNSLVSSCWLRACGSCYCQRPCFCILSHSLERNRWERERASRITPSFSSPLEVFHRPSLVNVECYCPERENIRSCFSYRPTHGHFYEWNCNTFHVCFLFLLLLRSAHFNESENK